MDLRIFTEPQQGLAFADLLAAAKATREHGFSAFFRSDHLMVMGDRSGLPGPSETFVTLGALAAQVPDIRFGVLVTSATFRSPGLLSIAAATVDDISGGRLDLGLGAGWYESEHTAYGVDFGASFGNRFDRLTEQLEILTGLWETPVGERFTYHGDHWTLLDSPALPKPVNGRMPLVIGGHGPKRTPRLAARYADDFNVSFSDLETSVAQFERVREACRAIDRDPAELVYSVAQTIWVGRDHDEVERRARGLGGPLGKPGAGVILGTPDEVVAEMERFEQAGVERMYLQVLDPTDLEHLELIGTQVRPRVMA
jgi:F420-dependent oxidoreductase-like protein